VDKTLDLEHEKIPKLLARYSIPAITGMVVQAAYYITDRIFVGHGVGADGISALTAYLPLMLIFMAFGMLFGIGGSAAFSIALGAKDKIKAEKIIAGTLFLLIVTISSLSIIAQIFAPKILSLFGASENIIGLSLAYGRIILAGAVINSCAYAMNNFVRAQGRPKTAMFSLIIGGVLNIILDYFFILVFKWGMQGAAFATVLSQTVSVIIVFSYLFGKRSYIKIKIKNFIPQFEITKIIVSMGFAQFAIQFMGSLASALLNNQLQKYGGDIALSITGIVFAFFQILFLPVFGINQGSVPIIGYNYGAKKFKRVMHTTYLAMAVATIIMTTGFIVTRLFPTQILLAFGIHDNETIDIGLVAIRIYFSMSMLIGFQVVVAGMFQAIGKPLLALVMSFSRQLLILVPLAYILPLFFGLNGIWLAVAASDFLAAIITSLFLFREIKGIKP